MTPTAPGIHRQNRSLRRQAQEIGVHDPGVGPATSPNTLPGLSRNLDGVLEGADVVVFA